MSFLRIMQDGNRISCECGKVTVDYVAWCSMTEWRQDKYKREARNCTGCADLSKPQTNKDTDQ